MAGRQDRPAPKSKITLELGHGIATAPGVSRELHVAILKELIGEQLRVMMCEELRAVIREELKFTVLGGPRLPADEPGEFSSITGAAHPDLLSSRIFAPVSEDGELPSVPASRPTKMSPAAYPPLVIGSEGSSMQIGSRESEGALPTRGGAHVVSRHMNRLSTEKDNLYNMRRQHSVSDHVSRAHPAIGRTIAHAERAFSMLGTQRAPDRNDCVSRLVDSHGFSVAINIVILLNSMFMVYAADDEIENYLIGPSDLVVYGYYFFFIIYSVEFMVKFFRYRLYYFYDENYARNWIDFLILLSSLVSMFIVNEAPNVSFLRLLRMLKMFRILRALRLLTLFSTLRAIVESLGACITTLFWSMVMVCVVHLACALLFVMRVASYFGYEGESLDEGEAAELRAHFGSTRRAFISLIFATNGGNDWSVYYEALEVTGGFDSFLFLCFVAFAQIALLNIILGIFVDQAIKSMMCSKEEKAKEHATELWKLELDLRALCAEANADNSGRITEQEWHKCVAQGNMSSYLDLSGFRVHDVQDYFQMCCNESEDGKVDVETFVRGCMRLRGPASCFDMQAVLVEVLHLSKAIQHQQHVLKQVMRDVDRQRQQQVRALSST